MQLPRVSGILLHPTSLPGGHGIGDLGPAAIEFLDFLSDAKQGLWQVLPLGPVGYADSPYQTLSAFAGNPLLISLDLLVGEGLLDAAELKRMPSFREGVAGVQVASDKKQELLAKAYERFESEGSSRKGGFEAFCEDESWWLNDFALFMALRVKNRLVEWAKWDPEDRDRDPRAGTSCAPRELRAFEAERFYQWVFFKQWQRLRKEAHKRNVLLMGDVPIYVAWDSADVWRAKELWHVDKEDGHVTLQAGVEPDYFSATGQLWGNPIYKWDLMREDGFSWWVDRFSASFKMFDWVRVDHFRGFDNYWAVPGGETTARHGTVLPGPGRQLFDKVKEKLRLDELPIVAENLGNIGASVERLREELGMPGMAVLQFAFGDDPEDALGQSYRPHRYPLNGNIAAYPGTHDNDTTVGWFAVRGKEQQTALRYLGLTDQTEVHWAFIRALMASVANLVVFPMQDVLGLGTDARMNVPSTVGGNWLWRLKRGDLAKPDMRKRLRDMVEMYDRSPQQLSH